MYALLLIATLGLVPREAVVADRADVIEVNHMYDRDAELVFDQIIFWEWRWSEGEYRVIAWRMLKKPGQFPTRDWPRRGFVSIWQDGRILRDVRAPFFRETWTQFDPELDDRKIVPQHLRRGLLGEPAPKPVEPPAPQHWP